MIQIFLAERSAEVEKITKLKYRGSLISDGTKSVFEQDMDIAFRVIADHIRAIAFPIADGQLPSNTGAGYVIRRILRRAVRYYFSFFDFRQPLLHKLIPALAGQFSNIFPELEKQKTLVEKVVFEEEQNFLKTLENGLSLFNSYVEKKEAINLQKLFTDQNLFDGNHNLELEIERKSIEINKQLIEEGTIGNPPKKIYDPKEVKKLFVIEGKFAFELYDTFGFPIDLTKLIAAESNFTVDEVGFNEEMQLTKIPFPCCLCG